MTPEQFGLKPIGTGAYRVTEFSSGDRLVMEAFDDWWGGKPPVKRITWAVVPEASARFAGLVSGAYDMIVSVPTDQEEVFGRYPDLTLVKKSITNYPMFAFNTMITPTEPDNPLADANLRKAMVSGVDMDSIVEALFGGDTFVPAPFNFPEYGPQYFDPARKSAYPYDPARAKQLLAASSYKGQPLIWKITKGFFPNYELAAELMVEQWKALGINVQMAVVDNFNLAYERPFHMLNMSMGSEFSGDPLRPLWIDWGPGSNRTDAAHKTWVPTQKFLDLGNAFERELDPAKRRQLYLDLVAEWENVMPALYMWRNVLTFAHRKGMTWVPQNNSGMRFYGDYVRFN
jgi:peptide/nickel transport system substrate-binding protein